MKKHTLGKIIGTVIGAGALAIAFAGGTPEVVLPAIAIGTTGIVFTNILTQETGEEKKKTENKKSLDVETVEEPTKETSAIEKFEQLKAGAPQALFKGVHSRQVVSQSGSRWVETRIEGEKGDCLVIGECLDKGPIVIPDEPQAEPGA